MFQILTQEAWVEVMDETMVRTSDTLVSLQFICELKCNIFSHIIYYHVFRLQLLPFTLYYTIFS